MKKLTLFLLTLLLCACATLPPEGITPVSPFDLSRYLGKWYEIARMEHPFERGLTDIHAIYRNNEDGSVEVKNRGFNPENGSWREAIGRAVFVGDAGTAALKVSFFGPFYGGYNVFALDPDYRWAMIMGPSRKYFWILARDKSLPAGVQADLLKRAEAAGIDVRELVWVSHTRTDN